MVPGFLRAAPEQRQPRLLSLKRLGRVFTCCLGLGAGGWAAFDWVICMKMSRVVEKELFPYKTFVSTLKDMVLCRLSIG